MSQPTKERNQEIRDIRVRLAWEVYPDECARRDVRFLLDLVAALEGALNEIDAIRNSIIGTQQVNWSAHIYPLVAALEKVGIHGQGYEKARDEASTLIQRVAALEGQLATLREQVPALQRYTTKEWRSDLSTGGWVVVPDAAGEFVYVAAVLALLSEAK